MKPSEQIEFIAWNYLIGYGIAQVSRIIGISREDFLKQMLEAMSKDATAKTVDKPTLTVVH